MINQLKAEIMEPLLHRYHDLLIKYVHGDPTDEAVLGRANIDQAHAAIIIPDESLGHEKKSDERTLMAVLSVKSIEPKVKVIAHILDPANEPHLKRANADKVVISDQYSSFLLSSHVSSPGIPELLDMVMNDINGLKLARKKIPHVFYGKTFEQLRRHFKDEDDALLLGFIKEQAGFTLHDMLSDDYSAVDTFIKQKLEAAGRGLGKKSSLQIALNPSADYIITESDVAVVLEHD